MQQHGQTFGKTLEAVIATAFQPARTAAVKVGSEAVIQRFIAGLQQQKKVVRLRNGWAIELLQLLDMLQRQLVHFAGIKMPVWP